MASRTTGGRAAKPRDYLRDAVNDVTNAIGATAVAGFLIMSSYILLGKSVPILFEFSAVVFAAAAFAAAWMGYWSVRAYLWDRQDKKAVVGAE